MAMEVIKVYITGHQHSNVIGHAFAEGCKGQVVPPHNLLPGKAAFYGILRGTGEILKQCEWVHRDYYYIDHGYFLPGHYDGYYRITHNGRQCSGYGERPPDRWESLNIGLRPWRRKGKHILICPLTGAIGDFYQIDPDRWLQTISGEISRFTDRPIVVKPKTQGDLRESLKDCWCLVTHSSNAAVDALLEGVPVITLGESACQPVSWDFETIENSVWPDREPWAYNLAYNQFTLDEMRNGAAWGILEEVDDRRVYRLG